MVVSEPRYIFNAFYIGFVLIFIGMLLVKSWKKYKQRHNNIAQTISHAFRWYWLGLLAAFVNTLTEYVFDIPNEVPNWSFFHLKKLLQLGQLTLIFLLVGNILMFKFFIMVFAKAESRPALISFWVYTIFTIILIVLLYFFIELSIDPTQGYIMTIINSLLLYIPIIVCSLLLRRRLLLDNSKDPAGKKLLYIFAMGVFFCGIFVFTILDSQSPANNFSIYYYLTIATEGIAAFMAYMGYVKEISPDSK